MKHVFLTGVPGVGKTTLVKKVCAAVVPASGFYTEEVRERGRRVGFDVVTLTGDRGRLSRLGARSSSAGRECRVGQYVVDVQSFESLALPLFSDTREGSKRLFVIDEIGKMELFSQAFILAVRQTLDSSSCSILGTIPVPKGKPLALVEEVRSRQDVNIFMITKENRDVIFDDILSAVRECLK
ncbi:cancer-related nucleoside-triphosphatase [Puntigrus tetrazona]|uniref:cancer-related nucleoside-triphosphatase n=1 Tax=Puntigrus tetrazona TaxID=1606681 RepID=UPI001C89F12C|nr:cancer-related nucleoside-triphosphatase [Puntigrus tetrazona]